MLLNLPITNVCNTFFFYSLQTQTQSAETQAQKLKHAVDGQTAIEPKSFTMNSDAAPKGKEESFLGAIQQSLFHTLCCWYN